MPRHADAVRAPDGRRIGIRCNRCGLVFANIFRRDRPVPDTLHADHTWTHIESPSDLEKH